MSKISTDLTRHTLNGPTMGTRWSAQFHASAEIDPNPIRAALAESVDRVDRQMSTWKSDSDLMRLNRTPVEEWVCLPAEIMEVLARAMEIGRLSRGAFDIGVGDAVTAWGFGSRDADEGAMQAALSCVHSVAHEVLDLDRVALRVRKLAPITLNLSGIAKGYAVDQMMAVLRRCGIANALVGLDGEMRARGLRPDGRPWTIALERPDYEKRAALSILELEDAAVATSGDYRHWVDIGGRRFSHTMDPARGGPLDSTLASVTVFAKSCMDADAWATALMVLGVQRGVEVAQELHLNAIFIKRTNQGLRQTQIGGPYAKSP